MKNRIFFAIVVCALNVLSNPTVADDKQEILIIYNHGSSNHWDCSSWRIKRRLLHKPPLWLEEGLENYEVAIRTPCTDSRDYDRLHDDDGCRWPSPCFRAEQLLNDWEYLTRKDDGSQYSPKHIFLAGFSAGAWTSILIKLSNPTILNSVIAIAPAFNGGRKSRLCRSADCNPNTGVICQYCDEFDRSNRQSIRIQHDDYLSSLPDTEALVFAFQCDRFGWPNEVPLSESSNFYAWPPLQVNQCINPNWRFFDGLPAQRCEPHTDQQIIGERCEEYDGYKKARILGCDDTYSKICEEDPHTEVPKSGQFSEWVGSQSLVKRFVTSRLQDWEQRVETWPAKDSYTPACQFLKVPKSCGTDFRTLENDYPPKCVNGSSCG